MLSHVHKILERDGRTDVTGTSQARSQPCDKGGGRFPQILDLSHGLKIEVPCGCLRGNLEF